MYLQAWFNHGVFKIKSLRYTDNYITNWATIHLSTLITPVFSQGYLNEDLPVFVQFPPVTDLPSILSSPPPAKSPSISYFHPPAIINSNSNSRPESSTIYPIKYTHGCIVLPQFIPKTMRTVLLSFVLLWYVSIATTVPHSFGFGIQIKQQ